MAQICICTINCGVSSYHATTKTIYSKEENRKGDLLMLQPMNLSQDELYKEILEYLEINNICTIALAYNGIPRAIPVEYRNDGADLYVVSEGRSHQVYQAGEKEKVIELKKCLYEIASVMLLPRNDIMTQPLRGDGFC